MEGTHAVGRQPFMPDSTLSRRSAALHARLAKYPSGNHKIIPRILKRRTAVVGLIFNIEAVLASIEGGTTKRPWAGARTFSDQVNVPKGIVTRSPTLTLVTPGPIASTIPAPSPPMTEGSFGFNK